MVSIADMRANCDTWGLYRLIYWEPSPLNCCESWRQSSQRTREEAAWILSRADPEYPKKMKDRLKEDAPAVLYGCGQPTLLESGGLAVVGSRHVDEALIEYSEAVGRHCALAKKNVISGAAPGIDRAAMRGALQAGGRATGVLADSLEIGR